MRAQGAWAAATAVAAFGLTGCSIFGSSSPSPSPTSTTPTMPAAACAEGDSVTPPDIADFTLDGVAAAQFATPLVVPYNGLKGSSDGQPSVLRLEVVTSTSGAPVRFRATGAQLLSSLTDDTLGRVTSPTLSLWGEEDPNGGPSVAEEFARRLPNSELNTIASAGHAPWIDQRDQCTQQTIEFLQR